MNFFEKNREHILVVALLAIFMLLVFCMEQEQKECEQKGGVLIDSKCLDIKELK